MTKPNKLIRIYVLLIASAMISQSAQAMDENMWKQTPEQAYEEYRKAYTGRMTAENSKMDYKTDYKVEENSFKRLNESNYYRDPFLLSKMIIEDFDADIKIEFDKKYVPARVGLSASELLEITSGITDRSIVPEKYANSFDSNLTLQEYWLKANYYKVRANRKGNVDTADNSLKLFINPGSRPLRVHFVNVNGHLIITGRPKGCKILDFTKSPNLWIRDEISLKKGAIARLTPILNWSLSNNIILPAEIYKIIYSKMVTIFIPATEWLAKGKIRKTLKQKNSTGIISRPSISKDDNSLVPTINTSSKNSTKGEHCIIS